jgi:Dolichyl-phosphate-mannose-protein mannosyltransferase
MLPSEGKNSFRIPDEPTHPGLWLPYPKLSCKQPPKRSQKVASRIRRVSIEHWIATLAILCAGMFAVVHLVRASIWYDEAITLLTTSGHAKLDWSLGIWQFNPTLNLKRIVFDLYEQDVHPPLYFWVLAMWRTLFGSSLEVARAFSALLILGSLGLLYRLGRDCGMRWPWVPVALYAASSAGMWYAYDARPYAMATFLILATQLLARKNSPWAGLCGAAAFATHYFAVLCVGPVLALECYRKWNASRLWSVWTALSFSICSAPLLLLLRIHLLARPNQYPGFAFFPRELWALLKGAAQGIVPNTWLPGWRLVLLLAGFLALAGIRRSVKQHRLTLPLLYGSFLLGFLMLAMVADKSIAQMPAGYYLGLAAPWMALLVGRGVNAFPRTGYALALAVVIGLIAQRPLVRTVDYRRIVARMNAECQHCPILVGTGYAGAVPACVLYEAQGMQVFLLKPEDSVREVAQKVGGRGTIFFIPSNEPPTAKIEDEFLEDYSSARKNGYFKVSLDRTPKIERAASQKRNATVAGDGRAGL